MYLPKSIKNTTGSHAPYYSLKRNDCRRRCCYCEWQIVIFVMIVVMLFVSHHSNDGMPAGRPGVFVVVTLECY